MKAMILAAGRGERMRPLTDTIPKPLVEINGKALIEYHLEALRRANIKEVVINVSYFPEQFQARLGHGERYGLKIYYALEPLNNPLETGGGIFNALPYLGHEPFLVLSADLWTNFSFNSLPKLNNQLAHIILVDNPPHHPEGDFYLKGGQVYLEDHDKFIARAKLNFAGIAVLDPILFQHCQPGKFSYIPLLKTAIAENLVTGEHFQGQWINVGTLAQLHDIQKVMTIV